MATGSEGVPAPPNIEMTDSVVSGNIDLSVTNIVKSKPESQTVQRLNMSLLFVSIILSIYSPLTDAWLVNVDESETFSLTVEAGLDDAEIISCYLDECQTVEDDLGDMYDNCTKILEDSNTTEGESYDTCQDLGSVAMAGVVEMAFIGLSILVMIGAAALMGLAHQGKVLSHYEKSPLIAAGLATIGLILWWVILPDPDGATLGSAAKAAIVAAGLAAMAGISTPIWRFYSPGERPVGIGARVGGENSIQEYPLRESNAGHKTLSLVGDGELLRIAVAKRVSGKKEVEDHFMTQKSAFTGFTHHRYDWLDSTRHVWWVLTGLSLILVFVVSSVIPAVLLAVALLLSLAQFTDPELLIFETNGGRHRILLYRFGSNRKLMNYSMDSIDSTVEKLLRGDDFDCSLIQKYAEQIEVEREEDLAEKREAERLAAEEAERQASIALAEKKVAEAAQAEAAALAAAEAARAETAKLEAEKQETAKLEAAKQEAAKQEAIRIDNERVAAMKVEAAAQSPAKTTTPPSIDGATKRDEENKSTDSTSTPATNQSQKPVKNREIGQPIGKEMTSIGGDREGPSKGILPAPPPPSTPLPSAVASIPSPPPAPTQPLSMQPGPPRRMGVPPSPPSPPVSPQPPVRAVPQSPAVTPQQSAPLPPPPTPTPQSFVRPDSGKPPPLAGLPAPPPPAGAAPMADPFAPLPTKEPSTYQVKAAPREELISLDEASDLLSELND